MAATASLFSTPSSSSVNPFSLTTPSPPGSIQTPPAPRHGYSDPWEPFLPRKSARLSGRAPARTPSPPIAASRRTATLRTARSFVSASPSPLPAAAAASAAAAEPAAISAMPTPSRSPRKRRMPPLDPSRKPSAVLTSGSVDDAAVALGMVPDRLEERLGPAVLRSGAGMLLTPAKTPRKTLTPATTKAMTMANIQAIARNLFHSDNEDDANHANHTTTDLIVTPSHLTSSTALVPGRQRGHKASTFRGLSFENFGADEEDEPIHIYTDDSPRQDRRKSSGRHSASASTDNHPNQSRDLAKRQVLIPGEGVVDLADAINRQDGLVFVFRGKKIFRKFAESADPESGPEGEGEAATAASAPAPRPRTRSQITPRLLFPSAHQKPHRTSRRNFYPSSTRHKPAPEEDDEEAVTDLDDNQQLLDLDQPHLPKHHHHLRSQEPTSQDLTPNQEEAVISPHTPHSQSGLVPATPKAPCFGPAATPPDTNQVVRFTRSLAAAGAGTSPLPFPNRTSRKGGSHFDHCRRIMPHDNKKRALGEPTLSGGLKKAKI